MAEGLLRDRLARRAVPGQPGGRGVHVHSAGLLDDGQPASGYGVEVLRARGIDLSGLERRVMGTLAAAVG